MTIFKDVPITGIKVIACRVGGPRGIVKAFAAWDGSGLVLIDTGASDEDGDRIARGLEESGHTLAQVDLCILTHAHGDHVGGLRRLRHLRTGAPLRVAAHRLDAEAITTQTGETVDVLLEGGETLPWCGGLSVLHLPGHSPGSLAIHHPGARALFAGDTLFSAGEHVMPPPPYLCSDPEEALRSAARVAASSLAIEHLFVAHGDDVYGGATRNLRRILVERRSVS